MRDVQAIWDAWSSGGPYVGDRKPSTRVTVEPGWQLRKTDPVLGTWTRGPARWYQAQDHDLSSEIELPNVVSVNTQRAIDTDAGSCDIVLHNVLMPAPGDPEVPAGQFGNIGALTWDHGAAQDAQARWQHAPNAWANVLTPNALLRTYQGFGGTDKTLEDAVADGNVILNGVWLIDDVTISTDGSISIKCRDMGKLLIDQQLFPPLVPDNLYPLLYKRWDYRVTNIPADEGMGDVCFGSTYGFWDSMIAQIFNTTAAWHSSTDEYYGEFNTSATGHQPSEAFDISYEPADAIQAVTPGYFAHQRTYWLSEPKDDPNDSVWIEFSIEGGASRTINQIYFHQLYYHHFVMVSVFENGEWIAPQTGEGGTTPQGVPYVSAFALRYDPVPGEDSNLYPLNRDYHASRVRLTITNLERAAEGGFRAGARKIMACFAQYSSAGTLVFAGGSIPVNDENPQRIGYWQVRANGHVYAFGDARTYPANSPATSTAGVVTGFAVHPSGMGYWVLDNTGRVTSHGQSQHYGDLQAAQRTDAVDIAPTPDGYGYWILTKQGDVHAYGSAGWYADSTNGNIMPTGVPALARAIESHPSIDGYWVVWSDGVVTAHNLPYYGSGTDRTGMTLGEYVTTIRRTSTGAGYWILSGGGKVQAFGDAVHHGDANRDEYVSSDWWKALTWELLPSSKDDTTYAIVRADGHLTAQGDDSMFGYGSVGEGYARQRFDGNYKDYVDIVRELLLWGGFYLYKDPQPATEMPDVFGNLESTGAWSDADLPTDMFDKRPIMDAIKQIRDIVGYAFYIDAEGGARFESPNWWALGNYLIDGTPYGRVPEIDERVQLTNYSVVRSASQARSRLIVANSNPMPEEPGKPPAQGVISTEITPRTASDLRGLVVPAMWVNGAFLKVAEQKLMAELIDLRSWFSRRAGSVTCVANPLIDINDQIRVLERQTGDVYIHYVRGVSISHDLASGSFSMQLNTHWLGGTPYGVNQLFRAGAPRPQGDGHWLATIGGYTSNIGVAQPGIYAYGDAKLYDRNEADSHLDLIVSMRSTPSGNGYYTLDRHGKILTYGDAVHHGQPLRTAADITDMALTPSGNGYWVVQEDGTVYSFGDATHYGNGTSTGTIPDGRPAWAEAIESHPATQGYWILFNDGSIQAFNLPSYGAPNRDRLNPTEWFTTLRRTESGNGYWVLSAGGVVKGLGDAPERGDAKRYPDENWVNGLCWTLIPGPDDTYAVVHSDSTTENFAFPARTPTGPGTDRAIIWCIVTEDSKSTLPAPDAVFGLSGQAMRFLKNTGSPAAINAVANGFGTPDETTLKAL